MTDWVGNWGAHATTPTNFPFLSHDLFWGALGEGQTAAGEDLFARDTRSGKHSFPLDKGFTVKKKRRKKEEQKDGRDHHRLVLLNCLQRD